MAGKVFQVDTQMVRIEPQQPGLRLYMLMDDQVLDSEEQRQYLVLALFLSADSSPLQFGESYTGDQLVESATVDGNQTDRAMWAMSGSMPVDHERWKYLGQDQGGDRICPIPWDEIRRRKFTTDGSVYECVHRAVGAAVGVVMYRGGIPRNHGDQAPLWQPCPHTGTLQWDYPYPDVKGHHYSLGVAASEEVTGRSTREWMRERLESH